MNALREIVEIVKDCGINEIAAVLAVGLVLVALRQAETIGQAVRQRRQMRRDEEHK